MVPFTNFPMQREHVLISGNTKIGVMPEICLVSHFQVGSWPVLPIFEHLRELGQVSQDEMMRTFNMGIGLIAAIPAAKFVRAKNLLDRSEEKFHVIGRVVKGERRVQYT